MSDPEPPELIPPWTTVRDPADLEAELARELGPAHPLRGIRARAIARHGTNDDVLFALDGGPAAFAIVHLTWSGRAEPAAAWPAFELLESLAVLRNRLRTDSEGNE